MDLRHPCLRQIPIRRQTVGFCAEGPGFYVWDEDPRSVRETLVALGWRPDAGASGSEGVSGRAPTDRDRGERP
jgi:hypothetical protein